VVGTVGLEVKKGGTVEGVVSGAFFVAIFFFLLILRQGTRTW
jgi:hypothetical protein